MRTGDESREATIVHIVPPFFFSFLSLLSFNSLRWLIDFSDSPHVGSPCLEGGVTVRGPPRPPLLPSCSTPLSSPSRHLREDPGASSQVPPSGNSPVPLHGYPTPSSNPREDPHAPSKRPETLRRHRRSLERLRTPSNASEPLRAPSNPFEPLRTPSSAFERRRSPSTISPPLREVP